MAVATGTAILASTAIAAAGAGAAMGVSARQAEKAREAAEEQARAQREASEQAVAAAARTPEEKAFTAMMRERTEAELKAPLETYETTTAQETEKALEALQKYYMQRGFQPSPRETGLLIEPSQKIARDIAIQNALLKRQAQQQVWERAYALTPLQERLVEQQAPLQAMPYQYQAAGVPGTLEQQLAMGKLEQATQAQQALGSMLSAYASPLLQQRIAGGGGGTSVLPEDVPSGFREAATFRY